MIPTVFIRQILLINIGRWKQEIRAEISRINNDENAKAIIIMARLFGIRTLIIIPFIIS